MIEDGNLLLGYLLHNFVAEKDRYPLVHALDTLPPFLAYQAIFVCMYLFFFFLEVHVRPGLPLNNQR
jgi:hypothetical protein